MDAGQPLRCTRCGREIAGRVLGPARLLVSESLCGSCSHPGYGARVREPGTALP